MNEETLRKTIAHILWEEDTGDISESPEYYLECADKIIKLCYDCFNNVVKET